MLLELSLGSAYWKCFLIVFLENVYLKCFLKMFIERLSENVA
jgi:hypothetical protein